MTSPQAARAPERAAASERSGIPAGPLVLHVTTVPISLAFLSGQVSFMRHAGFRVHAVSSPGPELLAFGEREQIPVEAIPMHRAITPVRDLVATYRLWRTIRRVRPDIVHSHTPKGGLLGMIAATAARVPVRVYHIRGLAFVTERGFRRQLLKVTEWTSCALAHRVFAVSHSMRRIAAEERVCPAGKIRVFLGGSGNGVDACGRFAPAGPTARAQTRAELGIPQDAQVIGFVGRLTRDKGVGELASAWARLRERLPAAHLLLVGWNELDSSMRALGETLGADPRVHLSGPRSDMPHMYAAMDVVALPTYREGFPNVALEAAAMALPIVATSVPGCVDAVQDGITGTLVPARDCAALEDALFRYAVDPALRQRHGEGGRRRVLSDFRREAIWEAIATEYRDLLGAT